MRTALIRFFAALTVVAVLVIGGVFLVTNTDWGREQVRKRLVAMIQDNSHGIIKVGRVTGNLLKGFTLHDVVITDSAGAPFAAIDEVHARYQLRALTSRRVEFDDMRLVRPVIVLDRQPGGIWNFDRIFPRDTLTPSGRRKTGWGTWIRFTDLTIERGDITVRSPTPVSRVPSATISFAKRWDQTVGSSSSGWLADTRRSRSSTRSMQSFRF